jgi:amino acid adenylation domain-containing protein
VFQCRNIAKSCQRLVRAALAADGRCPVRTEQLVFRHVKARPGACAVRDCTGRSLSYDQLWSTSARVARQLLGHGVGRGDMVAIALDRSIELILTLVAVARTGAAYVLLDPASPPARNAFIIAETGAVALIGMPDPAPWQPVVTIPTIVPSAAPPISGPTIPPPELDPAADDDLLYVAYTSGSTGRPKGVRATHRAVTHFTLDVKLVEITPDDVVASVSSPASDATTFETWKPLTAGATVAVLPAMTELAPEDWRPVLEREGISVMFLMAGLVDLVARQEPGAFAGLGTLVFGGEALDPRVAMAICEHGAPSRLVLGYGPTETTVFATAYVCTPSTLRGRDRIPLGATLDGYTIAVVDSQLAPVNQGEEGELLIGGPAVADGYLARPEITAERFLTRQGVRMYRTGDMVRLSESNDIMFCGRMDRQVKIRGYRVELEEVERAVLASGLVSGAIVDRAEGGSGNHYLVCFYVIKGGEVSPVTLAAAVASQCPGYMVPARWVRVAALPRNGIGKVDRLRLRRELSDHAQVEA